MESLYPSIKRDILRRKKDWLVNFMPVFQTSSMLHQRWCSSQLSWHIAYFSCLNSGNGTESVILKYVFMLSFWSFCQVNIALPIIFLIASIFLVIMGVVGAPWDTAIGIGIFLSGIPVYLLFVWWNKFPSSVTSAQSKYLFCRPISSGILQM